MIMERDVGRDDLLASGTTGEDGGFAIEWKARKTDLVPILLRSTRSSTGTSSISILEASYSS